MEVHAYSQTTVTVTLGADDLDFTYYNEDKRPFVLRQVRYFGGSSASIEGFAVLVDGSRGAIQRRTTVDIAKLPAEVFMKMREAFKAELRSHVLAHLGEDYKVGA